MPLVTAIVTSCDEGFRVIFPDFPECSAIGRTEAEAAENGRNALRSCIRDIAASGGLPPRPRGLFELRSDPEFIQRADGGTLVFIGTGEPVFVEANDNEEARLTADILQPQRSQGPMSAGWR